MFFRLLILFILVPIGELTLLIEIGKAIGTWPTIAIIVVTGIIGSYLLRWQGAATWRKFQYSLSRGSFPGDTIIEGVLILIGGAFLLTPGVVTDALGFILLIPPSRKLVVKLVKAYLKRKYDLEEIIVIQPDEPGPDEPEKPLDPGNRI